MEQVLKKITALGLVLTFSSPMAFSGTMGEAVTAPLNVYIGIFGGGGSVSDINISQFGTAFYTEAQGGPLAVNAVGTMQSSSTGLIGGHLGYAWSGLQMPSWRIVPALELEGYYLGGVTLEGNDINNNTDRLDEHNFLNSYPLKTGVLLANMVLNADSASFGRFHPYVGIGLGSAIMSISNAVSTQVAPPEPGVNHYNSDNNDTTLALAVQPKIGVGFDVSSTVNIFVEYRFLYLSDTHYTFGSTVYPAHVPTSSWEIKMQSQSYNFGTIGVNLDL